ncbi:MAG: DUF4834 family protein [Alistipes sp.]
MNFIAALFNALVGFIQRNPILCLVVVILAVAAPAVLKGIAVFILYFVLGLILLSVVAVLLFRWRIVKISKEMNGQFGGQQNPFSRRETPTQEGEVKVYKTTDAPEKRVSKDVGDYVDFEETKEPKS